MLEELTRILKSSQGYKESMFTINKTIDNINRIEIYKKEWNRNSKNREVNVRNEKFDNRNFKNSLAGLNSRREMREERFSEIKDRSAEIAHFDEHTDFKRDWKNEQCLEDLCNDLKVFNTHATEVLEGDERKMRQNVWRNA